MPAEPITGITVITGDDAGISAPAGYTKIDLDLNKGAGGDYVYLCYTQQSNQQAITDLAVVSASEENVGAPLGYTKIPVDLNKGAGGDFVYPDFDTNKYI